MDHSKMEIYCPECEETIDDSVARTMEEGTGEAPSLSGPASCIVCDWEVPAEDIGEREDPIALYVAHVRKEHPEMIEGTRYE